MTQVNPSIIRHEILDPENKEVLSVVYLNLDSVVHAKGIPGGEAQILLNSSVVYETDSPNQASSFWAKLFWQYLERGCQPIKQTTKTASLTEAETIKGESNGNSQSGNKQENHNRQARNKANRQG